MPQKFFITHSWKDIDFARKLCNDLCAAGLEGFLDAHSMRPGDSIPSRIERGLKECDVYVPVFSPDALKSDWCDWEIDMAITMNRTRKGHPRIIPVIAKQCDVPDRLMHILYIDFVGRYDDALNELLTKGFGLPPKPPSAVFAPPAPRGIAPRTQPLRRWLLPAGVAAVFVVVACILLSTIVNNIVNSQPLVTPTQVAASAPTITAALGPKLPETPRPTTAPQPTAVPPTAVPPTAAPKPTVAPTAVPPTTMVSAMDALVAAAKKEGQLTVIALPHDWCGYGDVIAGFKTKYALTVNELNPDAGSDDEVQTIIANKGNTGPQAPDVIDVGLSFGPTSKSQSLLAPYKVSTWRTIPDSVKDADGYWYGDYYGVLSFEVNIDLIKTSPQDWPDLLKPNYKNAVALAGDPRMSNQAMQSVYAAGLSAGAKTAAEAGTLGLNFFAQLNKAGNFVPTIGNAASIAKGATPIIIRWDYLALADADTLKSNPKITAIVPKTGVVAGVYVQAISAYAPHPNAAKLWMEYLYSDEGQIGWLRGYCHPIRYNDLAKNNKIPADLAAKLPPATAYAAAVFSSVDDQNAARDVITKQWDNIVGVNIR